MPYAGFCLGGHICSLCIYYWRVKFLNGLTFFGFSRLLTIILNMVCQSIALC